MGAGHSGEVNLRYFHPATLSIIQDGENSTENVDHGFAGQRLPQVRRKLLDGTHVQFEQC